MIAIWNHFPTVGDESIYAISVSLHHLMPDGDKQPLKFIDVAYFVSAHISKTVNKKTEKNVRLKNVYFYFYERSSGQTKINVIHRNLLELFIIYSRYRKIQMATLKSSIRIYKG